jgi:uncharacterized membrane protein YqhA
VNGNTLAITLGKLRYISIIAVVSAALSSGLMFIIGAVKTCSAYALYLNSALSEPNNIATKQAMALLIQGIDAFLIALVFLIFASGVFNLFIRGEDDGVKIQPGQHAITSIAQLKSIIAELIIIILFVNFMEDVLGSDVNTYQWEILVIPLSVVLLALGLKFLDLKNK